MTQILLHALAAFACVAILRALPWEWAGKHITPWLARVNTVKPLACDACAGSWAAFAVAYLVGWPGWIPALATAGVAVLALAFYGHHTPPPPLPIDGG